MTTITPPDDAKTNNDFIEYSVADDPQKSGDNAPQQESTDAKLNALYQEFKAKDEAWHQAETKKLLRKVDVRLLPPLVAMYLLNFLDRK